MDEKIAGHLEAIEGAARSINGPAALELVDAANGIRALLAELSPAEKRLVEQDAPLLTREAVGR